MARIIGIDLGTSKSAVALPELRDGEGFMPVTWAGCSIILDWAGQPTTPSVVAVGADGKVVVGYAAKNLVGPSPAPIRFDKRNMGREISAAARKQTGLPPEQVAEHILRYLKELAEGRP